MEYMANDTVHALVHSDHPVDTLWKLKMARDIALGIEHLHFTAPAVIHCDLKPENVFVARDFTCKVGDLGGSKHLDKPETHYNASFSPLYASPKRLGSAFEMNGIDDFHENCIDAAIGLEDDVFSFGVTLFELLSRVTPYKWAISKVDETQDLDSTAQQFMLLLSRGLPLMGPPLLYPDECVDSSLERSACDIAVECCALAAKDRPTMRQVARSLDVLLKQAIDENERT